MLAKNLANFRKLYIYHSKLFDMVDFHNYISEPAFPFCICINHVLRVTLLIYDLRKLMNCLC